MEYSKRSKPVWISSRVPADINCPKCGTARSAHYVDSPADQTYQYKCIACGAVVLQALEELNALPEMLHRVGA